MSCMSLTTSADSVACGRACIGGFRRCRSGGARLFRSKRFTPLVRMLAGMVRNRRDHRGTTWPRGSAVCLKMGAHAMKRAVAPRGDLRLMLVACWWGGLLPLFLRRRRFRRRRWPAGCSGRQTGPGSTKRQSNICARTITVADRTWKSSSRARHRSASPRPGSTRP